MAASDSTFTVKGTSIGCNDPSIIGRLTQLASEGRREVFTALELVEIIRHRNCVQLDDGTVVEIERGDPSNIAICVRYGEADCRWMSPEAINGLTPEGLENALKRR
jgi:hypothetical protein